MFQPPIQRSSAIYYRQLLTAGHGSPLWIPTASAALPMEYQTVGLTLGDVGIIMGSGGIDFLFNMHETTGNVHDDRFTRLDQTDKGNINIRLCTENIVMANAQVICCRCPESWVFESSATEGGLINLPHGAVSIDICNRAEYRSYVRRNIQNWYIYTNVVRGREARNGDLRFVYGVTKTDTWRMAAFFGPPNKAARFRLEFGDTIQDGTELSHSGVYVEVKHGPDESDVGSMRSFDQFRGKEALSSYSNQCVFMQTINVTLQQNVWDKLSANWTMEDDSEGALCDFDSTYCHTWDFHPSTTINAYLLRCMPEAEMAITEDHDWISILDKSDTCFPSPETLIQRIKMAYEVRLQDGVVFLQAQ